MRASLRSHSSHSPRSSDASHASPTHAPEPRAIQPPAAPAAAPLTLPETGFVRQKTLLRFVPFSKSTLWRHVGAGSFPAPLRLSAGVSAWRAEDVRRWIAEQT